MLRMTVILMTHKNKMPEVVELSQEEMDSLFSRLDHSSLSQEDKFLLKGVVRSTLWLRQALETGKITIHKLKRLFCGFRSEKPPQKKDESQEDSADEDPRAPSNENKAPLPKAKGHGRLGSDAYPDAEEIDIPYETLKPGSLCPTDCGGRLYGIDPGVLLQIQG